MCISSFLLNCPFNDLSTSVLGQWLDKDIRLSQRDESALHEDDQYAESRKHKTASLLSSPTNETLARKCWAKHIFTCQMAQFDCNPFSNNTSHYGEVVIYAGHATRPLLGLVGYYSIKKQHSFRSRRTFYLVKLSGKLCQHYCEVGTIFYVTIQKHVNGCHQRVECEDGVILTTLKWGDSHHPTSDTITHNTLHIPAHYYCKLL